MNCDSAASSPLMSKDAIERPLCKWKSAISRATKVLPTRGLGDVTTVIKLRSGIRSCAAPCASCLAGGLALLAFGFRRHQVHELHAVVLAPDVAEPMPHIATQ